jgi:hypothetical protein
MLIKSQCLIFITVPFIYVVFGIFRDRGSKSSRFLNLSIALVLAFLISLIWWHKLFTESMSVYFIQANLFSRSPNSAFKTGSLLDEFTYYIKATGLNISPLFLVMFLTGLLFFLKNLHRKYYGIILVWLVSSYLLLSFIPNKLGRYILPSFGAVALVSVIGWLRVPLRKSDRIMILLLFLVVGINQFLDFSWGDSAIEWAHAPLKNNYRLVAEDISKDIRRYKSVDSQVMIVEEEYFHGDRCISLGYFLKLAGDVDKVCLSGGGGDIYFKNLAWLQECWRYDFLIVFHRGNYQPDIKSPGFFLNDLKDNGFIPEDYVLVGRYFLFPEKLNVLLLANRKLMERRTVSPV